MIANEKLHCRNCDNYHLCNYYRNVKDMSRICENFNNTKEMINELNNLRLDIEEKGYERDEYGSIRANIVTVEQVSEIIERRITRLKGEA